MTLAIRVLIGLVGGFLLGLALAGGSSPVATMTIAILTPVGTVFVNLIRMTVVPLVASMLVASVGALTAPGGLGRTGVRALLMSMGLLAAAASGSALIAVPVLARIHIDQAAALAGKTRTEFVLDAASEKAKEMLLDRTSFALTGAQFQRFKEMLDAPLQNPRGVARLLSHRAPWETRRK